MRSIFLSQIVGIFARPIANFKHWNSVFIDNTSCEFPPTGNWRYVWKLTFVESKSLSNAAKVSYILGKIYFLNLKYIYSYFKIAVYTNFIISVNNWNFRIAHLLLVRSFIIFLFCNLFNSSLTAARTAQVMVLSSQKWVLASFSRCLPSYFLFIPPY